jgi:hypothetical protein
MSAAERQAKRRARLRAAREAEGVARREVVGTPFLPGHVASLKHGAYSARTVAELASVVEAELLADPECAHLRPAKFRAMVHSWCSTQAELSLLRVWLSRISIEQASAETVSLDEREVRSRGGKASRHVASQRTEPVLAAIDRADRRLIQLSKQLGLDPRSEAQLGGVRRAFDVAAWVAGSVAAARAGTEEPRLDVEAVGLAAAFQAAQRVKEILAGPAELPPAV